VLLQMAIIYVKPFQQFFGTASLTLDQLAVCLGLSLAVTLGIEIRKAFLRRADRA